MFDEEHDEYREGKVPKKKIGEWNVGGIGERASGRRGYGEGGSGSTEKGWLRGIILQG